MTAEEERQLANLMRLGQKGDREAYAELLAKLTVVARRYVRGKYGDVPWIDDVVQETLISVHRARRTYDATRAFVPWFYAIASNRLIDAKRRESRIAKRELGADTLPEPARPTAPDHGEFDITLIRRAVASLPPRQRSVIEAMKFRDESVREVSGRLGMTPSAVKVTAHRGYLALRRILGGHRED